MHCKTAWTVISLFLFLFVCVSGFESKLLNKKSFWERRAQIIAQSKRRESNGKVVGGSRNRNPSRRPVNRSDPLNEIRDYYEDLQGSSEFAPRQQQSTFRESAKKRAKNGVDNELERLKKEAAKTKAERKKLELETRKMQKEMEKMRKEMKELREQKALERREENRPSRREPSFSSLELREQIWGPQNPTCLPVTEGGEGTILAGRRVPIHRLFNPNLADHMYTTNEENRARSENEGYAYEGIMGYMAKKNTDPCCGELIPFVRMYRPDGKDHFYSADQSQVSGASRHLYKIEDINGNDGNEGYCVATRGACGATLSVYRAFHEGGIDHFYTTDSSQMAEATKFGYKDEGIECFIWKSPDV